jgi:hypothetical protein
MSSISQNSLEAVWAEREEIVYPKMFGPASRGIFVLNADIFTKIFQQESIDPRWLTHGVFEFAPTPSRQSWLYVTSGLSNPWETSPADYNPSGYSEIGIEFAIESLTQSDWPIVLLQRILAYNILLCAGRYGEPRSLDYGHRIPLGAPITSEKPTENLLLSHVVLAKPKHYPSTFSLASGKVDLLHLIGITESERDYAKSHSSDELVELLIQHGAAPITDPHRNFVI